MTESTDILKKLKRIEVYSRRVVNQQMAGLYESVFKGSGIAFSEIRDYSLGDDIRRIDWNVTARMNAPFVKEFSEERDRTVIFILDGSASTFFGGDKRERMLECIALLAFSAAGSRDKVGLLIFSDEVHEYVPPRRGRSHVMSIIAKILAWDIEKSGKSTNVELALEFFSRVTKRSSVAFLISDLFAEGWDTSLRLACRRHDVIPIITKDKSDRTMEALGVVPIRDVESGEMQWRYVSRKAAKRTARNYDRWLEDVRRRIGAAGADSVELESGKDVAKSLGRFFEMRKRRSR